MGLISTYASHKILNYILGREPVVLPTQYKLALSTTPLGFDGADLTEPTDTAYSRLTINNDKINFSAANNKTVKNIKELLFNESTQDWGVVSHFALFDNSGNLWAYGALPRSINTQIASSIILDANSLRFTLDVCGGSTSDMFITTEASNKILNYFFGGTAFTLPANYYVGLSGTPLNTEGIGMTEPFANEYERLVMPNNKNSFTHANDMTVTVAKEFRFKTADVDWGAIPYYFISETATGENVWWSGKLINSRDVQIATTLSIKPNGFVWKLSNCK